jgi:hypothetical protein
VLGKPPLEDRKAIEITAERRELTARAHQREIVAQSTANTLLQDLSKADFTSKNQLSSQIDPLRVFADAMGRFADACEKIDHFEDNHALALDSNIDVIRWLLNAMAERHIDIQGAIKKRRAEISRRHFYVAD